MEGMVERTVTDSQAHFRTRLTSDPAEIAAIRKAVEAFASAHGHGEPAVAEIGLVLNEAIANIIRHAYDGREDQPIEVDVKADPRGMQIELRDWGKGVVPVIKAEKTDPFVPGGLGLPCMKKMMTSLEFVRQPDGMLLKMYRAK